MKSYGDEQELIKALIVFLKRCEVLDEAWRHFKVTFWVKEQEQTTLIDRLFITQDKECKKWLK